MAKEKVSTLEVMQRMAEDDNKGIAMSTTKVSVQFKPQGAVIGFGLEKQFGEDFENQLHFGIDGDYIFVCFAIDRKELEKTRNQMEIELEK